MRMFTIRNINMTTLSETDLTRVSTSAAETFADSYYTALNASRSQLSSFYLPSPTKISYNGEPLTPTELQTRYEKSMPWTHFEPQSVNVHVLNSSLAPLDAKAAKRDAERNMSLVVQVSGYVRLVERGTGPMRAFSDSVVLVPDREEVGGRGKGKLEEGRKWVIQSQNFRFVV